MRLEQEEIDAIAEAVVSRLRDGGTGTTKRCLKPAEAGDYIGLSARTLREMAARGELKANRQGRSVSYDIRELDKWVERSKVRV